MTLNFTKMKRTSPKKASRQLSVPVSVKINPKWAWHHRFLLALRERLLRERGDRLAEASQPLEPHSMDMADSATDEFDHGMALSALSAKQEALFEIEEALRRISDGTYGVCEETGKPISSARLRAIPWARFSKEVEERLEAGHVVNHARLGEVASVRGPEVLSLEAVEEPEQEATEVTSMEEMLWQGESPPSRQFGTSSASSASSNNRKRTRGARGIK